MSNIHGEARYYAYRRRMLPGQQSSPGKAGRGEEGGLSEGDMLPGHTWEPEHEPEN